MTLAFESTLNSFIVLYRIVCLMNSELSRELDLDITTLVSAGHPIRSPRVD